MEKIEICKKYTTQKWKELAETMMKGDFTRALEKSQASEEVYSRIFHGLARGKPLKRFDLYLDEALSKRSIEKIKI